MEKAVILLGLGHDAVVKIATDDAFRMDAGALAAAIADDRAAGRHPLAVIATTGTTSTTSVDPVPAIADVCEREAVWLHVDAAYGGAAAIVPGMEWVLAGADRADSLVVNPHKWMLTPFDLSVLFCRHMDLLREAFSLVPEYLTTSEAPEVRNLMDTGVQLGRRFRSLKLWFVLRYFGAEGHAIADRRTSAAGAGVRRMGGCDPGYERLAPVPMSVVCFRACPPSLHGDPAALEWPERASAACAECNRRDFPVAHQATRRLRVAGGDRPCANHRSAPRRGLAADTGHRGAPVERAPRPLPRRHPNCLEIQ